MENQKDQIYMDCIPSFDKDSGSYFVDVRLRGKFDETSKKTIEEVGLDVILRTTSYDVEPLRLRFRHSDDGYAIERLFQLYSRECAKKDVPVTAILLIRGEPIHRSTFNLTDLLQE